MSTPDNVFIPQDHPPPRYSEDRKWWWDGYRWVPVPEADQPTPPARRGYRRRNLMIGGGVVLALLLVATVVTAVLQPRAPSGDITNWTAEQIASQSSAAVRSASAVHVVGADSVGGTTINADATTLSNGDLVGAITEKQGTYQYRVVGGRLYVSMTPAAFAATFPSGNQSMGQMFTDRWVYLPKGFDYFGISERAPRSVLDRIPTVTSLADRLSKPAGTLSKGAISTVNGQRAITLTDSAMSFAIAATGKPYVLTSASKSQPNITHWAYSDWAISVGAAVPTAPVDAGAVVSSINALWSADKTQYDAWQPVVDRFNAAVSAQPSDVGAAKTALGQLIQIERSYVAAIQTTQLPEPAGTLLAKVVQSTNGLIDSMNAELTALNTGDFNAANAALGTMNGAINDFNSARQALSNQLGAKGFSA